MHNKTRLLQSFVIEANKTDNAQEDKRLKVRDRSKQKTTEACCSNGTRMLQQNKDAPFVHLTTKTRSTLEHETYILNRNLCNKLHSMTIET